MNTVDTRPNALKSASYLIKRAARESITFKLSIIILLVFIACAIAVYYIERNADGTISSLGESFWWLLVTVATVGYGDYTTVTPAGRAIAAVVIIIGVILIPFMAAKFAAYMVTRRLREEKGLEKINARNHTIICGWNEHLKTVLDIIIRGHGNAEVVLVNTAGPDRINEMLVGLEAARVKYVHGDFTSEVILNMANIKQASSVIVLADNLQGSTENIDDRVVLATLAVKTMNHNAWVCSEVMEQKSTLHASRAGANEVIVHGEHDPFLISSAATS